MLTLKRSDFLKCFSSVVVKCLATFCDFLDFFPRMNSYFISSFLNEMFWSSSPLPVGDCHQSSDSVRLPVDRTAASGSLRVFQAVCRLLVKTQKGQATS